MTAILAISAFYHDSTATLVVDGDIIAAAQEERFTRRKHDHEFPTNTACGDSFRVQRPAPTRIYSFNAKNVKTLVDLGRKGTIDAAYTTLSLMVIELWCKAFIDDTVPAQSL